MMTKKKKKKNCTFNKWEPKFNFNKLEQRKLQVLK